MESQDSIGDNFLKRLILQGKIISQIITFSWRYDNNKPTADDPKKIEIARLLVKCFNPGFSRPTSDKSLTDLSLPDLSLPDLSLLDLFKADPRLHINEENPEIAVEVLITIFGRDRISNKETYLSPIFNSTELNLENKNNLAYYQFKIDSSGTTLGKLTDPEIVIGKENSLLKYIYTIPVPRRPTGVDNDIYEEWISNEKDNYPPNQFIPFTT